MATRVVISHGDGATKLYLRSGPGSHRDELIGHFWGDLGVGISGIIRRAQVRQQKTSVADAGTAVGAREVRVKS